VDECVGVLLGAVDTVNYTHHTFSIDVDLPEMQAAAHCDQTQQHCTDEPSKQQQRETADLTTVSQQVSSLMLIDIL